MRNPVTADGLISGLNHITLAIRSVPESFAFFTVVLGFKPVARWPNGAYLLCGDLWVALHLGEKARTNALPEYTHLSWSVSSENFALLRQRLIEAGAPAWQENWTEGESSYFLDPNGHQLEIHASDLAARLVSAKATPLAGA